MTLAALVEDLTPGEVNQSTYMEEGMNINKQVKILDEIAPAGIWCKELEPVGTLTSPIRMTLFYQCLATRLL